MIVRNDGLKLQGGVKSKEQLGCGVVELYRLPMAAGNSSNAHKTEVARINLQVHRRRLRNCQLDNARAGSARHDVVCCPAMRKHDNSSSREEREPLL